MNREQCEKIIGQALELIRTALDAYQPEHGILSGFISKDRSAAWMFEEGDGEDRDYLINIDNPTKTEDDDDDADS